jgi:hypothetical protein
MFLRVSDFPQFSIYSGTILQVKLLKITIEATVLVEYTKAGLAMMGRD